MHHSLEHSNDDSSCLAYIPGIDAEHSKRDIGGNMNQKRNTPSFENPEGVVDRNKILEHALHGQYEEVFRLKHNMVSKILDIFFTYGEASQIKKLSEELDELQEAIGIYSEFPSEKAWEHLVEEAADVTVVMLQFILSDTFDKDFFISAIHYKVNRQLARIKEEQDKEQTAKLNE